MKYNKKLTLVLLFMSLLNTVCVRAKSALHKDDITGIIKIVHPQENQIRFHDVIGHQKIKYLTKSIVPAFKDKALYALKTKEIPKSFLLWGPSRSGKKMLAKAFAAEIGSSIIELTGDSFMKMNSDQIRQLFAKAKLMAPCIVIIDGIYDFITIKQSQDIDTITPEMQVYLDEMDSLCANCLPVVIIGTLSYTEGMEFNTSGLFDFNYYINELSFDERIEFLNNQLKVLKKSDDFNIHIIARLMSGYSYFQLAQFVEKVQELAKKYDRSTLSMDVSTKACSLAISQSEESFHIQTTPEKQYHIAIHEAGHAIIVIENENKRRLHCISLQEESDSMGHVLYIDLAEPYISTEDQLLHDITGSFGGGVAEQVFCLSQPVDINSNDGIVDFVNRPNLRSDMRNIVKQAGKIVKSRCIVAGGSCQECSILNEEEIIKIIRPCYEKAHEIITAHKDSVKKLAERALEKKVIYADEAYEICGKKKPLCDFEKK